MYIPSVVHPEIKLTENQEIVRDCVDFLFNVHVEPTLKSVSEQISCALGDLMSDQRIYAVLEELVKLGVLEKER